MTGLEAGDLFKLGEDLLMPMAKSYWDAVEGKMISPSPILIDIIAGSLDIHHAFQKSLQYLIEALRQTQDAKEGTKEHKLFVDVHTPFLRFLRVDEEIKSVKGLNRWLQRSNRDAIIQSKLTEIKNRSKRLKAIGWHVFSQELVNYIKNSIISAASNKRFIRPLLTLKFQFEIAVGMENNEEARKLINEIESHLTQEMTQAKTSGLFSHENALSTLKKQIVSVRQAIESKQVLRKSKHREVEMKRLIPVIPERKIEFKEEDEKEKVEEKRCAGLLQPTKRQPSTTLVDSLRSPVDTEEIESKQREEWELDTPLLSDIETSSDVEFKDQKSKDSKQSQSYSNEMENFRYDFPIGLLYLLYRNEKIMIEIGEQIFNLDKRASGCCVGLQNPKNFKSQAG